MLSSVGFKGQNHVCKSLRGWREALYGFTDGTFLVSAMWARVEADGPTMTRHCGALTSVKCGHAISSGFDF